MFFVQLVAQRNRSVDFVYPRLCGKQHFYFHHDKESIELPKTRYIIHFDFFYMASGQKMKSHKVAIRFLQKVETLPKFETRSKFSFCTRSKLLQFFAEDLK